MTYFTIFHWLLVVFMIVLLITGLYYAVRYLKGQILAVASIVLILGVGFITILSLVSLDKVTKKAQIVKLKNKRILRTEMIVFEGYVINTGKYTIGESVFNIRLINHGHSAGKLKSSDIYRPVSLWERFFPSKLGPKSRPNAIEKEFTVARMLKPGERRKFKFRFRFPSYFKDIAFRTKLYNH